MSEKMISALIVSKYHASVRRAEALFAGSKVLALRGYAENEEDALSQIDALDPKLIMIILSGGDTDLLNVAKRIYLTKPKTSVIVCADELDPSVMNLCVRYGVKNAGPVPESRRELEDLAEQIISAQETRQSFLSDEKNTVVYSSSVVGFYSVKDGMGRTTLVINTAAALAKAGKSVALVDLDLEFGDICYYLDIDPKKTIADLCQDLTDPNINDIEKYMIVHSSGMHILPAPKSPEYAEVVSVEKAASIISILKTYYDLVIIDLPSGFNDFHQNIFRIINKIMIVTDLELPSIKNTKAAVNIMDILQVKSKANVIIERYSKFSTVTMVDVHKSLGCRIVGRVNSDFKTMAASISRGIPIVQSSPTSTIGKCFLDIARYLVSKNNTLDIWDMNDAQITKAYDSLYARWEIQKPKNKKKKRRLKIFRKLRK